jgi:hypothetical protein
MANPIALAFCRTAVAVRFIALEILETGVFAFEWAFSSVTSAFDHGSRGTRRRFAFLAIFASSQLEPR